MNSPALEPLRQTLNHQQYESLRQNVKVLSRDEHGDKVLLTPDGRVIKLFRRKRLLSSALIDPYANRFARASLRLAKLGVKCPAVEAVYRIPSIRRHAVVYPMLVGTELRHELSRSDRADDLLTKLAAFLAVLHEKGIYFRAVHFGNVLVGLDMELGLIDVSETRFSRGTLGPDLRARNFKPLASYEVDRVALLAFGLDRFIRLYLQQAKLESTPARSFLARLTSVHPMFKDAATAIERSLV